MTEQLKSLGKSVENIYDFPDTKILESFENPFSNKSNRNNVDGVIRIEAPEFTCLCPITGSPDFATIIIEYRPNLKCVESKSLKLYLGAFRQFNEFHEACINRIANDLIDLLDPHYLKCQGLFKSRGGITFTPVAEYYKYNNTK